MPKPHGLNGEGYWEYYRNREALHRHGAVDTTSSNSRYTTRTRRNLFIESPKEQEDDSGPEVNNNPVVEPKKKKFDDLPVEKINNKPKRINDDPYGDSSDEEILTPEVSEPSSSESEDKGQGSNEVQCPVVKEPKKDSHEDGDTSENKAKKKLFF